MVTIEPNSQLTTPWVVELFPRVSFVWLRGPQLTTLEELAALRRLDSLEVDTRTSLRSLEVLAKLRLQRLCVQIQRAEDHAWVGDCAQVDDLVLVSWQESDVTALADLAVEQLQMERGQQTSLRGLKTQRLRHVLLQRCSQLKEVGPLRIPSLTIEACNRLDLDSLGDVKGLRSLWLLSQKGVESFEFVKSCQSLVNLTVGIPIKGRDLRGLIESPTLRFVWLGYAKLDVLREVGMANRKAIFCNPDGCIVKGKEVRSRKPYDQGLKAFLKDHDLRYG